MRTFRIALIALCVLTGAAWRAVAQTASGEVHLRVIGPDGVAQHNVDVTLEPIDTMGARAIVSTGALGRAFFQHVSPGRHRAHVIADGHEFSSSPIQVRSGEAVVADLTPRGPNGEPGQTLVARRYQLAYGTSFSREMLEDLPGGESVWPLIETAEPFTIADGMDTGGVLTGQPSLIGSHASSWTNTAYYTGSSAVTDVYRGGVPLFYPDLRASESVIVTSALAPIEIDTAGPAVTVVSRRPTPEWHASLGVEGAPGAPLSDPLSSSPPPLQTLDAWSRGSLLVSGPLVMDRVGIVLAGTMIRSTRVERTRTVQLPGNFASLSGHLLFTPRAGDEVSILTGFQRTKHPFGGRFLFSARDGVERDTFGTAQAAWDRTLRTGAALHLGAAFNHGTFSPDVASPAHGPVERLYDGPIAELGFAAPGNRTQWSSDAGYQLAPRTVRGAVHAIRAGATFTGEAATTRPLDPVSGLVRELVGGVPARVWDYGYAGPESRWREATFGAYAADRMTAKRLVAELGVRVDTITGSAAGVQHGITWHTWSPRFAARWTPLGDRLAILGGYGRYHYQLPLSYLAFGDPAGPQGSVFRWTDFNGDGVFEPGERGPLVARIGPGSADGRSSIDPGLRRPRAHEYVIGAETVLTPTLVVRFVGIARREHHLIAGVDTGVPASDYDVRYVADPGLDFGQTSDDQLLPIYDRRPASFGKDQYLLSNPANLTAGYEGFDLTVEKRLAARWQMLFGAAACRSRGSAGNRGFQVFENDQGVIGELLTNPNATLVAEGRLFFERGYTIKTSATYRGPHDVRAAVAARYQDGQHFARMLIAPGLNQGTEAIPALPNGKTRYTFVLTIDGRVEKGFTLGHYRLAAVLQAFNLLNTRNEVEEDVVSGPGFRNPTAIQSGPVVRVGFNVGF